VTWVLFGVMLYVLIQMAVGLAVSAGMRTESDYLLAGRRLGFFVSTMTIFATWFGAETCVGSAGAFYDDGFAGGRADPFGYTVCILVMGLFFAAALWRRNVMTLGDLFRIDYGISAEKIAVLITAPTSILWAAAQVRAFGQVISASSSIGTEIAITVAAAVVIVYTTSGGMLADAITDFIQGIAIAIGLIILAAIMIYSPAPEGGFAEVLAAERLSFRAPGESFLASIESWAIPIAGSLFIQELLSRILASKSALTARRACLTAAGLYVVVGTIPAILGLLGPAYLPDLEHSDQILPHLAQAYLPTVLYILFAGALISAILSTVDSTLLAASAIVSHNVAVPLLRIQDERKKVRMARTLVVVGGVIAYALAISSESVFELVEASSTFGSAGVFVAVLFTFMPLRGGVWSANAAMVTGMLGYMMLSRVESVDAPFVWSLVLAFLAYVLFMFFQRAPRTPVTEPLAAPRGAEAIAVVA